MKTEARLDEEKANKQIQESHLNTPTKETLMIKQLKTIVKEYNLRTGKNVTTKKLKRHTKAFDDDGNEITKTAMVEAIIEQNKTMHKQATKK